MPRRPKTPCRYSGCPELSDETFCPEHKKIMDARYNKFERDPRTAKRYGRTWRKIRAAYLDEHPLCEKCHDAGRLTAASEVHHQTPLADGGGNNRENLMALCHSCHSAITARAAFNPGGADTRKARLPSQTDQEI